MNTKTKKIFAREFIYFIIATSLFFLLYFCYNFFNNRNYENLKKIQNKIEKYTENSPNNQLLWFKLKDTKFGTKTYEDFKLQYSNVDKQKALFYLLKNNGLYLKSINDFRSTYFKKDLVIDNLYYLFKVNNWEPGRTRFIDYLKDEESDVLNKSYNLAVQNGYKGTLSELKELLFKPDNKVLAINELKNKYTELNNLNRNLEKAQNSIFRKNISEGKSTEFALILFCLFFPFRYLVYILKWSFKQIK